MSKNAICGRETQTHVRVMDEDCPEIDEDEEAEIQPSVKRKQEDEDVLGQ